MNGYNTPSLSTYVAYNDKKEVDNLDLNTWDSTLEFSGKHLYEKPALYGAIGLCSPARNPDVHYIYGVERQDHPDHSSRFGYGRFPNGYGVGNWSSGFYNMPPGCDYDPQPPNMAPERFYSKPYQGRNRVNSQASVDWNNFSNTFNGPFVY